MIRAAWCTLLALAVGGACMPKPAGEAAAEPVVHDTGVYTGTVRVVGSLPVSTQVVLQPEQGRPWTLTGPLVAELQALAGAELAVRGEVDKGVLQATAYQIRSVDGAPVETGVVERAPGGGLQLRRPDGSVLLLGGGASHLQPGHKVWVQGPQMLQVQTFGVIAR